MSNYQKNTGVIAAGHELTAEAGAEILRLGGNAFDAALAAKFAATVVEPGLASLGGGGFLLAHTAVGQQTLFDFFPDMPSRTKPKSGKLDFFPVSVDFGSTVQEFHVGYGSVAVPGVLKGIFHVHERLGKLPIKEVLRPAIEIAREGHRVNAYQAFIATLLKPIFLHTEEGRGIFGRQGSLIKEGDVLKMPLYADALESLGADLVREVYEGSIGDKLIREAEEQGGLITKDDLRSYEVIERKPLRISYRGDSFSTNPLPSSGGILIAFALKLLESVNLSSTHLSYEHLHQLAGVMEATNRARAEVLNGGVHKKDIAEYFLSDEVVAKYVALLQNTSSELSVKHAEEPGKNGSTTHISVIDGEGNAASITTSNGEGSGYCIPGCGIMLNNMLGEEDLNIGGFHQYAPRTRIASMMAPTMILCNGRPEIVLGSGGSNRIRTAILQTIVNIMDFNLPVHNAVSASRIHWERGELHTESGIKEVIIDRLRKGHAVVAHEDKGLYFGGVHTAVRGVASGKIDGAGDERRGGVVKVVS